MRTKGVMSEGGGGERRGRGGLAALPLLKRGLGISAIATARFGDLLNSLYLQFSFFSFFNRVLIGEAAKALKKENKQTKLMSSIRGGKKAFSGRSPWHG